MAPQNFGNTPDLAAVLKTLSTFSNQTSHNSYQDRNASLPDDHDTYEPPDAVPPAVLATTSHQKPSTSQASHHPPYQHIAKAQDSTLHSSSSINARASSNSNAGESSSITTWPAALKQVMRTVAQNEEVQRRIRFLIQRQHDHERQWWQGREALVRKQTARSEKKKELDQVLLSVGAPVDSKEISTAAEDQAELQNYDAKVYRASRHMADAMVAELRGLDIPFFCLKQGLILAPTSSKSTSNSHDSDSQHQEALSSAELSILQRRMLELLQDLCKD